MAKNEIIIPALAVGTLLLLSKSKAGSNTSNSPTDYITNNMPFAYQTEKIYKVPALFTISQAGLESGWGKSAIAINANNHFGIKSAGWKGPTYKDFRKYNSVQSSFDDHARFLKVNPRYAFAFKTKDPVLFAQAVANAGYDEAPGYLDKIKTTMATVTKVLG